MLYYFVEPLLLDIFGNTCIAIICYPGCGVTKFEIELNFLIKKCFYMVEKSWQKFKYLEN